MSLFVLIKCFNILTIFALAITSDMLAFASPVNVTYSSKISAIRYEAGLRVGDNTNTMPNVDGEEIASTDCDVSLVQANCTEGDLCPESESNINTESSRRATALHEATKPVSERAEVAIETPAILYENALVEYAQPNMRELHDDNPIHKRVGTNLRKVKSL
jgi:hypothetical protein